MRIKDWADKLDSIVRSSKDKLVWTADEVAAELGVSLNYARDIMRFYAASRSDVKYERGRLIVDVSK